MIFLAKLVGLGWKVKKKRTRLIEIPGVLSDFLKSTRFICFSTILSGYLQTNIHPFRLMKLRSKFFSKVLFLLIYIPWVHTFFYPECIHFFSYSLHAYILYVYLIHTTLKLCMILFLIQPWFGIQSFMLVVIQQSSTKYILQTEG